MVNFSYWVYEDKGFRMQMMGVDSVVVGDHTNNGVEIGCKQR